jgi:hypothetical protein
MVLAAHTDVLALKKIMKISPIIIIDSNPNSILNNIEKIFSSGRNKIERDRSPSNNLSIFKESVSKKDRRMNMVEAGDESARLIDFLIKISDPKAERKESKI